MKTSLDTQITTLFPTVKTAVLIVKGVNNKGRHDKIVELLRQTEKQVQEKLSLDTLSKVPKIHDWREAYRKFGFKPAQFKSSVEALLRRVLQGKELPNINPLVNLYNLISIKYAVPGGGDDLDKIEGSIRLTVAEGTESFTMLGASEKELVKKGEVIYRDDKEVLCRAWNYRECEKSKITEDTKNVALILEGLENTDQGELVRALKELRNLIEEHLGGECEEYLLDKHDLEVSEKSSLKNKKVTPATSAPDYHKFEEFQNRKAKLEEIKKLGIDPYPHKFEPTNTPGKIQEKLKDQEIGNSEEAQEGKTAEIKVAGRIVLFRAMGKNAFGQIQDESGRIQLMFNRDNTTVKNYTPKEGDPTHIKFIEKKIDLGDIIGVTGHLFRTGKGELTVYVKEVELLCKTLLPLPDKHAGLTDKGVRYRKRWLDLIANPENLREFHMRSKILKGVRKYCEEQDFTEVETPVLQNSYGGAEARPFISHLNALHQDMYLRISLEIPLKKLIVGGLNRVYEMGKVFRNEGIDKTHNPEFTEFEAYAAYWDYNDVMTFTENLFAYLAMELFGSTKIGMRTDKSGNEHEIDLQTPWKRLSMVDSIKTFAKINPEEMSDDEIRKKLLDESNIDRDHAKKAPRGKLIAYLFEEFVEEHLIQPHHIIDHPIETTPLCKLHRDPKLRKEQFVERFETFILGYEFCNAYSELNDPIFQRKLLEEQAAMKLEGDENAVPMDEEFIEAICQGLPPTGGLGIGIDRMTMLFTGATSIRDVLFFPLMRPED